MSVLRALVWKEWRESWWLLVLAAALSAGTYALLYGFLPETSYQRGMQDNLIAISRLAAAVQAIISLVLGASLFAPERARGTLNFLIERPTNPRIVWKVKTVLALGAMLAGLLLFEVTTGWLFPPRWDAAWVNWTIVVLILGPFALAAFGAAALCSALFDRPVMAFAAGGVVLIAVNAGLWLISELAAAGNPDSSFSPFVACAVLLAEAALFTVLSRWAFLRWGWR